jgi:hypothetical protein
VDNDLGDDFLLRQARNRKNYECEQNTDRRGATT